MLKNTLKAFFSSFLKQKSPLLINQDFRSSFCSLITKNSTGQNRLPFIRQTKRAFSRSTIAQPPRSENSRVLSKDVLDSSDFEAMHPRRFADRLRLEVEGGAGGPGCFSFIRTRVIKTGHADGGNGGQGGPVFVQAQKTRPFDLSYIKKSKIAGNPGKSGKSNKKAGEAGRPLFLFVPEGTRVFRITESSRSGAVVEKREYLTPRPLREGERVLVAKGGFGGLGSTSEQYASNRQAGLAGQQAVIELLLSIPNEVGLLGFARSGKTSLLGSITRMVGKIQEEGPSTFHPSLGILKFLDERKIGILDLPPISPLNLSQEIFSEVGGKSKEVPAESQYQFSHHLWATKLILFVIEGKCKDFQEEVILLLRFVKQQKFEEKKVCFVVSKIDLLEENEIEKITSYLNKLKAPFILVSEKEGKGLEELVVYLRKQVIGDKKN